MRGSLSAAFVALLLAGCFAAEETPAPASATTPAREAGMLVEPNETVSPMGDAPPVLSLPILLEGNTGTSAVVCAGPLQQCAFQGLQPGLTGVLLEELSGRILGGEVVLTWTPATPATQELSYGVMTMGAEACEGASLAVAQGPSPLPLIVPPMERPLCEGEVVHLWVSGTTWGGEGGLYYQVDVDQAFRAEGAIALQRAA